MARSCVIGFSSWPLAEAAQVPAGDLGTAESGSDRRDVWVRSVNVRWGQARGVGAVGGVGFGFQRALERRERGENDRGVKCDDGAVHGEIPLFEPGAGSATSAGMTNGGELAVRRCFATAPDTALPLIEAEKVS